MSVLTKQPSETLVLYIEFADQLAAGDSLNSIISVTESTGAITITGTSITGTKVQGTYSGGVDGTLYTIEAIVDTAGSETLEVDVYLLVTDSPPGMPTLVQEIRVAIADFLGWGRNSEGWGTSWTDEQEARLDDILDAGHKQFIYHPPPPGEVVSYRWSFLRPTATFDTVASTYLYDLPSDFGSIVGDLVYDEDEDVHRIIEQKTPGLIDRNRAVNDYEGRPYIFALRPKSVSQTSVQVTELMLYPTPDAAYGIVYHYDAKVDRLCAARPLLLGGAAHVDTIMQSCRDIAATRYKDQPNGPEHQLFLERLKASIEADRRQSPKTIGMNNDGQRTVYTRHGTEFTVTMTGTV
jgi:hypothetical protein